jgi:hypothetical protein
MVIANWVFTKMTVSLNDQSVYVDKGREKAGKYW